MFQGESEPIFIDLDQERLSPLEAKILVAVIYKELPPPKNLNDYDGPTKLHKMKKDIENNRKTPYQITLQERNFSVILSHSLLMRKSEKDFQNPIRYERLPNLEEKLREQNSLVIGSGSFGEVVIVTKKVKLTKMSVELKNHRLPRAMKIMPLYPLSVSSVSRNELKIQIETTLKSILSEQHLLQRVYEGVKDIVINFGIKKNALKAYLLMPLFKGRSLDYWLYHWTTTPKSLLDRLRVFKLIAKATEDLHQRQIIHRDLKPHNMVYDEVDHTLYIGDFGLSVLTNASDEELCQNWGTAEYIAPETLEKEKATFAIDTFANGGVLAQFLTMIPDAIVEKRSGKKLKKALDTGEQYFTYDLSSVLCNEIWQNQCSSEEQSQAIRHFIERMSSNTPQDRPSDKEIIEFITHQIKILNPNEPENDLFIASAGTKVIEFKPIVQDVPLPEATLADESFNLLNSSLVMWGMISFICVVVGLSMLAFAPHITLFGIACIFDYVSMFITGMGILGFLKTSYDLFNDHSAIEVDEVTKPIQEMDNSLAKFNSILGFKYTKDKFIETNSFEPSSKPIFAPAPVYSPYSSVTFDTGTNSHISSSCSLQLVSEETYASNQSYIPS